MSGVGAPPPGTALGRGPASPDDIMRAQRTIAQSISQAMEPSDRLIAQEAEAKLISHARTGFWIGTLSGAALAFRGRFAAGRAAAGRGISPRLFFPSAQEGSGSVKSTLEAAKKAAEERGKEAGGEAAGEAMRKGRAALMGKAVGYGIIGSVFGTWIGVQTGKSAANTLLDKSGRREAIDQATTRGIERAADELSKTMGGKVEVRRSMNGGGRMVNPAGARAGSTSGDETLGQNEDGEGVGYGEPGREMTQEPMNLDGVGYSDRAPPQDQLPSRLSDSTIAAATSSSSSSSSSSSRWDELRRSRAAPPSRWDALREQNARTGMPRGGPSDDGNGYERELMDPAARDAADERARKQREFDALFAQEASGGDDSLEERRA
ncbi:hypothetical protein JCM8208_001356 [Rhodotorula glutinis]